MQTNIPIDAALSTLEAQQWAERLAAEHAIGESVALAVRLKHACRLHDKVGADDAGATPIAAEVYLSSAYCLRVMGDLLTAQAVAERGLLYHPAHVPLVNELVAVHEALALRYREVARRYQSAMYPPNRREVGGNGD
jgi:hypothetical protein